MILVHRFVHREGAGRTPFENQEALSIETRSVVSIVTIKVDILYELCSLHPFEKSLLNKYIETAWIQNLFSYRGNKWIHTFKFSFNGVVNAGSHYKISCKRVKKDISCTEYSRRDGLYAFVSQTLLLNHKFYKSN